MRHPYVFLDRDGTLIEDTGYLYRLSHYRLLPRVEDGLRALRSAGFGLAIVTNQSGIGRGYFGAADFERLQRHLLADLARRGVQIDATYHCPHHPTVGCACRKPATGMLDRAAEELGADLARSWVVGDSPSDVQLARNAGCGAVQVRAPFRTDTFDDVPLVADVAEAARRILAQVQFRT